MSLKKPIGLSIAMLLIAGSLFISSAAAADPNTLYVNDLVRIDVSQGMPHLPRNVEIVGGAPGYVDIILPRIRLPELDAAGITYTVQITTNTAASITRSPKWSRSSRPPQAATLTSRASTASEPQFKAATSGAWKSQTTLV
jgi:hypothetical protein